MDLTNLLVDTFSKLTLKQSANKPLDRSGIALTEAINAAQRKKIWWTNRQNVVKKLTKSVAVGQVAGQVISKSTKKKERWMMHQNKLRQQESKKAAQISVRSKTKSTSLKANQKSPTPEIAPLDDGKDSELEDLIDAEELLRLSSRSCVKTRDEKSKKDCEKKYLASNRYSKTSKLVVKRVATAVRVPRRFSNSKIFCVICQVQYNTKRSLRAHMTADHGTDFKLEPMLALDKGNQIIGRNVFTIRLVQIPRAIPTFQLKIVNSSAVIMVLRSVHVFDGNQCLLPVYDDTTLRMVPGYSLEEDISIDDLVLSSGRRYSLLLVAEPLMVDENFRFQIVEQYHFKDSGQIRAARKVILMTKLPIYPVPDEIRFLFKNKFKNKGAFTVDQAKLLVDIERFKEPNSLTTDSYSRQLRMLNQIEDEYFVQEFRSYTVHEPILKRTKLQKYYTLSMDQFKETRPSNLREDGLVSLSVEMSERIEKFEGIVEKVDHAMVLMKFEQFLPIDSKNATLFKIEFIADRTPFQLEYHALELLTSRAIEQLAFPKTSGKSKLPAITKFEWLRESITANKEQMAAVQNIVNQTSIPAPYILFGPPGTGKTSTIVEAIGQIYRLRPKANILVAATSNFAANEVTNRLLSVVPDETIFRFFSKSCTRKADEFDDDVLDVSNLSGKMYHRLAYEDLYLCRVVVCTLATAGRLVQAKIAAKHFSYIFIDECGSAKEISALIPIAGIATFGNEITANIILAGDPRQLGPVIQCDYLKQTSHETSMLERFIDHEFYRPDPVTGDYNMSIITQLRDNYRSHRKILHFSNHTFYQDRLRAKGSSSITDWAIGWRKLPNKDFPIILHPVVGRTIQDKNSPSLYNTIEAEQVMEYVGDLLANGVNERHVNQEDIGIISPYARQVMYLKNELQKRKWREIEVGSVEQYQGREKPIIIISTVRTRCSHVGFLSNVKRMNVTLTRAQALMIVVGDLGTLSNDSNWKKFITYCKANRGLTPAKVLTEAIKSPACSSGEKGPKKTNQKKSKTKNNIVASPTPIAIPSNSREGSVNMEMAIELYLTQLQLALDGINWQKEL